MQCSAATSLFLLTGAIQSGSGQSLSAKTSERMAEHKQATEASHSPLAQQLSDAANGMSAMSPSMQAYAGWQISQGFARLRQDSELSSLKRAFLASTEIEGDSQLRASLQQSIMSRLIVVSPDSAESLISVAEPPVRYFVESRLLEHKVAQKRFDEVEEKLYAKAGQTEFPFGLTTQLMLALPPERHHEWPALFGLALNAYKRQDPVQEQPEFEDIATMIVRFWRELPDKLVLEAIDEIFKHAQEEGKSPHPIQPTLGTSDGDASFSSLLMFRYFELVPVLRELDTGRAEKILRDNPAFATVMNRYPAGLSALDPAYRGTPLDNDESFRISSIQYRPASAPSQADATKDELRGRMKVILTLARSDPRRALTAANELPNTVRTDSGRSPRANVLATIARLSIGQDDAVVRLALEGLGKSISDFPPVSRVFYECVAADVFHQLHEDDKASQSLENAFRAAKSMYEKDTDKDDPNTAFIAMWPSAVLYRSIILAANKSLPELADSLLREIKDPEIAFGARIALINGRLGVLAPSYVMQTKSGKSKSFHQEYFSIP